MKRLLLTAVAAIFFSHFSFSQTDVTIDTVVVGIQGRGETPAPLEGTWVLKSGIKIKSKEEVKLKKQPSPGTELHREKSSITKTTGNGGKTTITEEEVVKVAQPIDNGMTPPQGSNLHYPDKPGISFYGENETFTGYTGCNKFSGRYSAKDNRVSITTAASTKMACMGQYEEKEFMGKLERVNRFKVSDGKLELMNGNDVVLTFTRE